MVTSGSTNLTLLGSVDTLRWRKYLLSVEGSKSLTEDVAFCISQILEKGHPCTWLQKEEDLRSAEIIVFGFKSSPSLSPNHAKSISSGVGWPDSTNADRIILRKALRNLLARRFCQAGFSQVGSCFVGHLECAAFEDSPVMLEATFLLVRGSVYLQMRAYEHHFRRLVDNVPDFNNCSGVPVILSPSGKQATLLPFQRTSKCDENEPLWNALIPQNSNEAEDDALQEQSVPGMVSVKVGAEYFQHPSRLVLLKTDTSESSGISAHSLLDNVWASLLPSHQELVEDTIMDPLSRSSSSNGGIAPSNSVSLRNTPTRATSPVTLAGSPAITVDQEQDLVTKDQETLEPGTLAPSRRNSITALDGTSMLLSPTEGDPSSKKRHAAYTSSAAESVQPIYLVPECYSEISLDLDPIPKRFKRLPYASDVVSETAAGATPLMPASAVTTDSPMAVSATSNSPDHVVAAQMATVINVEIEDRNSPEYPSLLDASVALHGILKDDAGQNNDIAKSNAGEGAASDESYQNFSRTVSQAALTDNFAHDGASFRLDTLLSLRCDNDLEPADTRNIGLFNWNQSALLEFNPATSKNIADKILPVAKSLYWLGGDGMGPVSIDEFLKGDVAETRSGVVDTLPIPQLLLGHQDKWISISPNAVPLWERLSLQPFGDKRSVRYVVIGPKSLQNEIKTFIGELTYSYESCELGSHQPLFNVQTHKSWEKNLISCDLPAGRCRYSDILSSYSRACDEVVNHLSQVEETKTTVGGGESWEHGLKQEAEVFVVYMVEPSVLHDKLSGRCLQENFMSLLDRLPNDKFRSRCIYQPLHMRDIVMLDGSTSLKSSLSEMMKQISFSVFLKSRKDFPDIDGVSESDMLDGEPVRLHVPLFVLSPRDYEQRWFEVLDHDDYKGKLDIAPLAQYPCPRLHRAPAARLLHVAYCYIPGQPWVPVVWTDTDGVMLESAVIRSSDSTDALLPSIMHKTNGIVESTDLAWRLIVCKLGTSTAKEALKWDIIFDEQLQKPQGDGTGAAIVSATFISVNEADRLRIFLGDDESSDDSIWMPTTRAFIQASPFAPFDSDENRALATSLLVTEVPSRTVRSGRVTSSPTPWRICSLRLELFVHKRRAEAEEGVYPLDADCPRSVLRFISEQYNALSWLTIGLSLNSGRQSGLAFHLRVLQRMASSIQLLGSHVKKDLTIRTDLHGVETKQT